MRLLLLVVCAFVLSALPGEAQIMSGRGRTPQTRGVPTLALETDLGPNRQPTFRTEVTRVQVSVRVTDAEGRFVRGLTAADFTVSENGKRQDIVAFDAYRFDAGMTLADVPALGPVTTAAAVATNVHSSDARVFALVIDDLHIHPRRTERARAIGREFVDRLHPSDLLLVATTSGRMASYTFSRDRTRALQIIESVFGQRLPDATAELMKSPARHLGTGDYAIPGLAESQQQRVMQLEMAYESIARAAAAAMGLEGRRKTLLFVSEGSPVGATVNAAGGMIGSSSASLALRDALAAATVADMVVYTVTPTGLDVPGEYFIESNGRGQEYGTHRILTSDDLATAIAEHMQTKTQLRDIARLTGGLALIDTNDASRALERIMDEASEYYVLAYEPDNPAKNDRFRSIAVDVARPDVRVVVRRGYTAPRGVPPAKVAAPAPTDTAAQELQSLLSAAVPSDRLLIRAQAIPLGREADGTTHMAVVAEIGGAPLAVRAEDGPLELSLALLSVDATGTIANATRKAMRVELSDAQARLLGASALRTVWDVALPKGWHQVRMAVMETTSALTGSVYLDVEVPEAGLSPGIAIGSRAWTMVPTAFVEPRAAAGLQVPPTVMRVFPQSDVLQVTVAGMSSPTTVVVRDARNAVLWQQALASDEGIRQFDLPLAELVPGPCRLVIGGNADAPGVDFVVLPR
jgi:VWFA-related protein